MDGQLTWTAAFGACKTISHTLSRSCTENKSCNHGLWFSCVKVRCAFARGAASRLIAFAKNSHVRDFQPLLSTRDGRQGMVPTRTPPPSRGRPERAGARHADHVPRLEGRRAEFPADLISTRSALVSSALPLIASALPRCYRTDWLGTQTHHRQPREVARGSLTPCRGYCVLPPPSIRGCCEARTEHNDGKEKRGPWSYGFTDV